MNAPIRTQELFYRVEKLTERGSWKPISGTRHISARDATAALEWHQWIRSSSASLRIVEVTITITPL